MPQTVLPFVCPMAFSLLDYDPTQASQVLSLPLSLTFTFPVLHSLSLILSFSQNSHVADAIIDLKLFLGWSPLQKGNKPQEGQLGSWTWLQLLGVYFFLGKKRKLGEGSKKLLLSVPLTSSRVYFLKGLTANAH